MSKNLLKGFLGSAATLALALNMSAASAQDDAVSHFAGLNFGVGYGFEVSTHGDDEKEDDNKVPTVQLNSDTIFGENAVAKSDKYANITASSLKPESAEGKGTPEDSSWQTYGEEQEQGEDQYGQNTHVGYLSFKNIVGSDDKKRSNMQHYGWLSAGWLYPISGDLFVEPQLTLKVKGTPEKRKVKDEQTVYSSYLSNFADSDSITEIGEDASKARNAGQGSLMIKLDGILQTVSPGATILKTGTSTGKVEAETFYQVQKIGDKEKLLGEEVSSDNTVAKILANKILGDKNATGVYLNDSLYATRDISFELKNNFEAALHGNLGYAFNQYFAVYAKLGMSLDFYKLDYKKGPITWGVDDYQYSDSNFYIDASDLTDGNLYLGSKEEGMKAANVANISNTDTTKFAENQELAVWLNVKRGNRTGAKDEWKDKQLVEDPEGLQKMLDDAKLSVEKADDDVTTSKKSTFVSINADFGLGMMANVYKGLQVRAEFVYSLPMNKEKKMYNDNVTLTMKPHKFKFNFGVVVPLNMMMGK